MLTLTSCKPTGPDVSIPSGSRCNDGANALDCTRVPPQTRDTSSPPRFALDGEMAQDEYWGAIELPYSDETHHDASGKLYVAVESPTAGHATTTMHVFAQHIRADENSRELRLYLDLKRLDRAPAGMDDEDRMIALTPRGDVEVRAVSWFGSSSNWYAVDDPNFDAHIGSCGSDAISGGTADTSQIYCDAEFQIELTPTALPPAFSPTDAPIVGMAFAMYSVTTPDPNAPPTNIPNPVPYFSGSLPETFVNHLDDDTDRTQQMSLEFATPHGVPIKFLSWNLAHWGTKLEWTLNSSSPFRHVDLGHMAEIMKDYDVVAVQEMWSTDDARTLLDEINSRRAADEQMTMAGPIDFPSHVLSAIGRFIVGNPLAGAVDAIRNTQGGVFIFSRFPVVESNHITYDRCMGEDCIKAKGVLHVRLALRPPGTGSESRGECSKQGGVEPGLGCEADPTGEMYVDVYDTHMQAGQGKVCGAANSTLGRLADSFVHLIHPDAMDPGTFLHCDDDPLAIKQAQYRQLADFVARTSTDPNRTIIAGDFNTNGRRIGPADPDDDKAVENLYKYQTLLHILGVYEASETWPAGPAHIDGMQDDTINLHPEVFPWDIDHGDIAREEDATYEWRNCGVGTQSGTGNDTRCRRMGPGSMGVPSGTDRDCSVDHAECTHHDCDLWDNGRLDYIFVGAFPGAVYQATADVDPPALAPPRPSHPSYLLGRGPLDEPVWRRLQPIQSGAAFTCGRNSRDELTLLSDHAPIAGNLMLFPMRQPAKFHPEWDHALMVRVVSADVTGTSDCIGGICGETELYLNVGGARTPASAAGGPVWPQPTPFHTHRHCHGWTLPNEDPSCMYGWGVWRPVIASDARGDEVNFKLWDSDSLRDDHFSIVDPGSDPHFIFDWRSSTLQIHNESDVAVAHWPLFTVFRNTDPIRFGRAAPPNAGFVIEVREQDLSRPRAVAR